MENNYPHGSRFAVVVNNRLAELGMSIRDLSIAIETTYEHVRKICRGHVIPSKYLRREIAKALQLSGTEVDRLVTADGIDRKFGSSLALVTGKIASMAPLEEIWEYLSTQQQSDIITQAEALARKNQQIKNSA